MAGPPLRGPSCCRQRPQRRGQAARGAQGKVPTGGTESTPPCQRPSAHREEGERPATAGDTQRGAHSGGQPSGRQLLRDIYHVPALCSADSNPHGSLRGRCNSSSHLADVRIETQSPVTESARQLEGAPGFNSRLSDSREGQGAGDGGGHAGPGHSPPHPRRAPPPAWWTWRKASAQQRPLGLCLRGASLQLLPGLSHRPSLPWVSIRAAARARALVTVHGGTLTVTARHRCPPRLPHPPSPPQEDERHR